MKIDGVKNFILVRQDGHLIIHNVEDPDKLTDITVLSGLGADAVKAHGGFTFFKYLMVSRANKENYFIFQIEKYFLGIIQKTDAFGPDLAEKVLRFLQAITRKKAEAL